MKSNNNNRMALVLCLVNCLFILGVAETQKGEPPRARKVFTNEDLQKYRERSESEATPHLQTETLDSTGKERNPDTLQGKEIPGANRKSGKDFDKAYWANKLKEAERNLGKAKIEELRFIESLADFQEKLSKVQNDFHKQTAQWQIEDSEKNLARARDERKKVEAERAKVLEDALKKGFKAEELNDKELNPATEELRDEQKR
jgi:hypothetical protein